MKAIAQRNDFRRPLILCIILAMAATVLFIPLFRTSAQNSSAGTIHAGDTSALTWTGSSLTAGAANTESVCQEGVNCDSYTLNVAGTKADWAGKRVQVQLNWQVSANEYDIYIHQGSLSGPLVTSSLQGPGLTGQTAFIDVSQWGTGTFVIHVAYDTAFAAPADP